MEKISNFHTHTFLCKHATGKPIDYVLQAKNDGCCELGFSDHCPYPDSLNDFWPEIRMSLDESKLYRDLIQEAKEAADFPVRTGYECEWDETCSEWYDELKENYGAEYLVLGSHWLTLNNNHIYVRELTETPLLHKYTDQTIKAIASKKFNFIAHPDILMIAERKWTNETQACLKEILNVCIDCNVPMEINGLGIVRSDLKFQTENGERSCYPFKEFWEIIAKTNIPVICNADAHSPDSVIKNALKSREFAAALGITPINSIF